ncbi:hypothetical protein DM813_12025 [Pseudomonas alkylphenolica]|uniref:Uncharacterized protein n=1 Tax=Pseudomonas alkylphenolica TaxID=237609 RepID=A0A443ZTJ5_9PSED|nr:hypothetical protein [Pseudomonas alkylphenolica]RWU22920.1 hypothetical protein DM813_12025 [Pseudomonas alkylphenolica]
MASKDVKSAIINAKRGIQKYLALMDRVNKVNVSTDADFRRAYNGFYRVQRRAPDWYDTYYSLMEQLKGTQPTFAQILDHLYAATERYEPSFSSKLVATLRPDKPVWDIHVLRNVGEKAPDYKSKTKVEDAKERYADIERWYQRFLPSDEGVSWVTQFNEQVPEHGKLTDLKKVDFILWQMRD